MKWFSGQKVEYPRIKWIWICCKLGKGWKPGWACTWPWPWQNQKFQNFFLFRGRTRFKPSLVFMLSLVCSTFKFMYPRVINFLAWKPLHMVNLTSKYESLGQIYHVKWFSGQKIEYPQRTWTCCKPGWAWKPGWACTWSWPYQKKC